MNRFDKSRKCDISAKGVFWIEQSNNNLVGNKAFIEYN